MRIATWIIDKFGSVPDEADLRQEIRAIMLGPDEHPELLRDIREALKLVIGEGGVPWVSVRVDSESRIIGCTVHSTGLAAVRNAMKRMAAHALTLEDDLDPEIDKGWCDTICNFRTSIEEALAVMAHDPSTREWDDWRMRYNRLDVGPRFRIMPADPDDRDC